MRRLVLLLAAAALLFPPLPSARATGEPPSPVLPAPPPLSAPTELVQAGDVDGGADLAWSPPPGPVDGYILFLDRTLRGDFYEFTRCREPRFRAVGLKNGATYGFRVAAMRGGAVSPMSNAIRVTPSDITPPPRPEGLAARADRHAIALSWRKVESPDFLHYTVYRRAEADRRYMPLEDDTGLFEPAYVDRHVAPGTRYIYKVTATDRAGNESRRSEGASARTLSRAHLSVSLFDRKIYAYCFNPNDRTLFLSYAYEENPARWAAWRRVGHDLPLPDGVEEAMNCFAVTRTSRGGRAFAHFPVRGEVYECREREGERWSDWRLFAADGERLRDEPGRSAHRDIRFHAGQTLFSAFDPVDRTLTVRRMREGGPFDPDLVYPARIPAIVGETSEVHLSLLSLSGETALLALYAPGSGKLVRASSVAGSTAPVEVIEWGRDFPAPPNL